ncbi:MAG: haloacid dehalogenase-like hydrolase [Bacilli bacterium]|nr:haloacid dehalogenase-like hydrolase [Bacilli bacterium]
MNVYDFDKTICKDDTEQDFFYYELRHRPINWIYIPYFIHANILRKLKIIDEPERRHRIYLTLKHIKDIDQEVIKFWKWRKKKILDWYKAQQKEDDIVVSASPRFLLEPILIALNIKHYVVSEFDVKARRFIGPINVGEEKVRRFMKEYDVNDIDNFYTDSMKDMPMILVSKNAFIVDKHYQVKPFNNKN